MTAASRSWPPPHPWAYFAILAASTWAMQGCGDDSGHGGAGGSSSNGTQSTTSTMSTTSTNDTTNASGTTTTTTTNSSSSSSSSGAGGEASNITQVASDATKFVTAFDATPSPDGSTFYFTGINADGNGAVFSASGNTVTELVSGAPLGGPFGIATSSDGATLFVADPASIETDASQDKGRLFSVIGSTVSPLVGADGHSPRGVEVHNDGNADQVFFTGNDTDGQPAVFSMEPSGANAEVVAKGAPLTDPSGISVADDGKIYVLDTTGSDDQSASVIVIDGGTATLLVKNLHVGFPAGIAVHPAGNSAFVMGYDKAAGHDAVIRLDLSADPPTSTLITDAIDTGTEPAGLHRAKAAEVFALVDSKASGGGAVYSLHP